LFTRAKLFWHFIRYFASDLRSLEGVVVDVIKICFHSAYNVLQLNNICSAEQEQNLIVLIYTVSKKHGTNLLQNIYQNFSKLSENILLFFCCREISVMCNAFYDLYFLEKNVWV